MVTYAQLKDADPSAFSDAAHEFDALATALENSIDDADSEASVLPGAWTGESGEAAVDSVKSEANKLSAAQSNLTTLSGYLDALAEVIRIQRNKLLDAEDQAADIPGHVTDDGTVKLDSSSTPDTGKQAQIERIQTDIDDAIDKATEADETAKDDIAAIVVDGEVPSGAYYPESQLPKSGDPQDVKQWWDGLSAEERQYVLANYPGTIGELDGVPSVYRDLANRSVFNQELAYLEEQVEHLYDGGNYFGSQRAEDEYEIAKGKLDGMGDIQDRLNNGSGDERAYLLLLDTEASTHGDGRAIVSIGNPDTADNVFTHVPGTGAGLEGIDGDLNRVESMAYDANQLDSGSTAGILWLGYDAPDDVVPNAGSGQYAEDAAEDLRQFQSGLEATSENPDRDHTMTGHSYGTTVIGEADSTGDLKTDRMLFVASPGVTVDNAAELSIDPNEVYATTAYYDIIHVTPPQMHGESPITEDFGGNVVSSEPGLEDTQRLSTDSHSHYWKPHSEFDDENNIGRDNFALIITGDTGQVEYAR